ncbi:MAG: type III polyketide synthase [Planctomycetota bacterium]|nr:type III polyketide synthase [Planctomycetota bacterium]
MHLAAVARALPPHRYPQGEITAALARVLGGDAAARALVARLHRTSQVEARHLALPLDAYADLAGFGAANDAFIRVGTDLAAEALTRALDAAGLRPRDLDVILTATVTGVATPSLDARLVNRLGLRPDVRRVPLFGLGCVAGAAGLARLHDHLRGWPDHVGALVSVELCSLTFQRGDASGQHLVATSLFGDGAAAVVATGPPRPGAPRVVATRSRFYPDTERAMGWDVTSDGFRVVLAQDVPALVRERLGEDVRGFLADHGLTPADISAWVCHPGGPKVLEAAQAALGVGEDALALSWRSLRALGNLSSASVLLVLEDTLRERPPPPGARGLLLAMGPGFCAELVLLAW